MNTLSPVLFNDFVPGALLGEYTEVYSPEQALCWREIFADQTHDGEDLAAEAASMAVVNMMRAYLKVVTPRPPGNVHARQQLHLAALPEPGEAIHIRVYCAGKEIRRERRYVDLKVQGTGNDGRIVFDALLGLIWAA